MLSERSLKYWCSYGKILIIIVDVESDEAKRLLIEMLRLLFEEWYIARHEGFEIVSYSANPRSQKPYKVQ